MCMCLQHYKCFARITAQYNKKAASVEHQSPADAPSLHDYLWETEKAQDGDPPPAAAGDGETGQDRPVEKGQNSNQKASDCVIPSVCGSNKIYNIRPKASVTCR